MLWIISFNNLHIILKGSFKICVCGTVKSSLFLKHTHKSESSALEQQRGQEEETVISCCRKLKGRSAVNMQICRWLTEPSLTVCQLCGKPLTHTHTLRQVESEDRVYQCATPDGMSSLINLCDMNTKSEGVCQ